MRSNTFADGKVPNPAKIKMCDYCDAYWLGITQDELHDLRNPIFGKYRRLFPGCEGWQYAAAVKRELETGYEAKSKEAVRSATIYYAKEEAELLPSSLEAYKKALARFDELLASATDEPIYKIPHHCFPISLPRPEFISREIKLLQRNLEGLK